MPLIRIEDDARIYSAEDGETVLLALRRHRITLPSSCEAGECGTCKVQLLAGEVHELDYDPWALEPEVRVRGIVLACRATVWSDIEIRRLRGLEPQRVLGARVLEWDAGPLQLHLALEAGELAPGDVERSVTVEGAQTGCLYARIVAVDGRHVCCVLQLAGLVSVTRPQPGDVVVLRLPG
ncbi:MAG: 2Fe-2S iron-sulfur cluster binding domain-containing protein [Burkholderiales bacterium]|nr:2Fe-2S iron-sulfur cluster binding domain-containing protein [Burkholderiales bacterium]